METRKTNPESIYEEKNKNVKDFYTYKNDKYEMCTVAYPNTKLICKACLFHEKKKGVFAFTARGFENHSKECKHKEKLNTQHIPQLIIQKRRYESKKKSDKSKKLKKNGNSNEQSINVDDDIRDENSESSYEDSSESSAPKNNKKKPQHNASRRNKKLPPSHHSESDENSESSDDDDSYDSEKIIHDVPDEKDDKICHVEFEMTDPVKEASKFDMYPFDIKIMKQYLRVNYEQVCFGYYTDFKKYGRWELVYIMGKNIASKNCGRTACAEGLKTIKNQKNINVNDVIIAGFIEDDELQTCFILKDTVRYVSLDRLKKYIEYVDSISGYGIDKSVMEEMQGSVHCAREMIAKKDLKFGLEFFRSKIKK